MGKVLLKPIFFFIFLINDIFNNLFPLINNSETVINESNISHRQSSRERGNSRRMPYNAHIAFASVT